MRRSWVAALGLLTIFLLAGDSPLRAAPQPEVEPGKHAAETAAGHGEEEGIFGKALDLGIWTIVVFLALLFVLKKFAWGPMLEGLRNREENIRSALEEAQRARDEAQNLRAQLQKEMATAHDQVRALIEEARRDAQHLKDDMTTQARNEIQVERDRMRREVETAKDQALQELWTQAAQLATLISAKAIRRQISPEDHRRLIEEAVADLNEAGQRRQRETAGVQA